MAGASSQHEEIAGDLFTDLRASLEGKPCRVFKGALKPRIDVNHRATFFYPDIMVACDPADNHRYCRERPAVLVEILSEDDDRDLVTKFALYTRIPSLEEYIVLSQDPKAPRAHVHRRANRWEQEITEAGGELEIRSLGLTLPLARLYRSVAEQE